MKVFIFGNRGNMGRRYASILKFLGHECSGCEAGDSFAEWTPKYQKSDAVIVATNTKNHMPILEWLVPEEKHVLCEKPLTTDMAELRELLDKAANAKMKLSMVSQYDFLPFPDTEGETYYDFYKSGNDGLAWDCINVIWHAKGKIVLKNESPIWRCEINDSPIDLRDMDYAYVEMIESWLLDDYKPQYERILGAHKKVVDYLNGKFN